MDAITAGLMAKGIPYEQIKAQAPQTPVGSVAAITSTAPSAGYVQAEATALRADVVALQATVAKMVAQLAAQGHVI